MNKQKYFVKWIEIKTAAFKFSRTSEQGEQSEQTLQSEQSEKRWTKWTNSNTWSNELRFRQPLSNPWEQVNKVNKVNKQKYLKKWIEIQTASFKSSRTGEQCEWTNSNT